MVWISVALVIVIVMASTKPVMIAYHRHQMERFHKAIWNESGELPKSNWLTNLFGTENGQELDARFEHHRAWLVSLGELVLIDYTFQHIQLATPEWSHLWRQKLLPEKCPPFDHAAGVAGSYSTERRPAHLQVWCHPTHRDKWTSFLNSVDVADSPIHVNAR